MALVNSTSLIYTKVLTCGVFDIIHAGHISFFKWIKDYFRELNPYLTVAINTDESLFELNRNHIHNFTDRFLVLESIKYIDNVIPMPYKEPTQLIFDLQPYYFVKGGDYLLNKLELPEYKAMDAIGGELVIYPQKTHSSRAILDKLISFYTMGYHDVDEYYKGE